MEKPRGLDNLTELGEGFEAKIKNAGFIQDDERFVQEALPSA